MMNGWLWPLRTELPGLKKNNSLTNEVQKKKYIFKNYVLIKEPHIVLNKTEKVLYILTRRRILNSFANYTNYIIYL